MLGLCPPFFIRIPFPPASVDALSGILEVSQLLLHCIGDSREHTRACSDGGRGHVSLPRVRALGGEDLWVWARTPVQALGPLAASVTWVSLCVPGAFLEYD